jgi:hypothetical protein
VNSVSTHQIRVEEKQGESSRLYRWACACGEAGAVWYRGPVTAERTGSDHLDKVA